MRNNTSTHHAFPVFGLLFAYLGCAAVGGMVAFAYLVSLEPTAVDTAGKTREEVATDTESGSRLKTTVTYFRSSALAHTAQALARKVYASKTNRFEITTLELNAWAMANLAPIQVEADNKVPFVTITPQTPTFQIAQEQLHVAYPLHVSLWGSTRKVMLLCSGDFESTSAGPDWRVKQLYLNSAPLPFKRHIYQLAKPQIMRALSKDEEAQKLQAAWKMVRSIQVGDVTLLVDRQS